MKIETVGCAALMVGLGACAVSPANGNWPNVEPVSAHFAFSDVETAGFERDIVDLNKIPIYRLRCHSGSYESPKSDDHDYSGLIDCWLQTSAGDDKYSLLRDTATLSADWATRGRFLAEHMIGECGNTPDWGRERTFRVRGMKIVLAIQGERFSGRVPTSYEFAVSVERDSRAIGSIAEPPSVPEPAWFKSGGCP